MTVAYDFGSTSSTSTSDISFTHTPVGTPRGIIVLVAQAGGVSDEVTGVTYGGVPCTEFAESPVTNSPTWAHYGYFLGSSIPTGAQTVVVSTSGSTTKIARVFGISADADTEIVNVDAYTGNFANNLIGTLALSGRDCFVATGFTGSDNSISDIAPVSGWTQGYESNIISSNVAYAHRYNTIGSSDVDIYQGTTTQDIAGLAVAVSEVVGGGVPTLSASTFVPGSLTSTGWRPQITAS